MKKNKKIGIIILLMVFLLVCIGGLFVGYTNLINIEKEEKAKENVIIKKNTEEDIVITKEKINLYLFWGDGCSHCKNLKYFLSNLDDDYKDLFNLYTFEVWYNEENKNLMYDFAYILEDEVKGVPYLIIGDSSFKGYSKYMDDDILNAIKEEYYSDNRFDAYEEIKNKL